MLGQRTTTEKSNEKTAIPELLATLALEGCIVTIDAMGTQPNIAQAIRDRGADYILAVKDNQPTLADSVQDFFVAFQAAPNRTPHHFAEVVEKDHGRLEVRRCYVFEQIDCLHAPKRWPDLKSFAVIASERTIKGKTSLEHRFYITSLPADAARLNRAVRAALASGEQSALVHGRCLWRRPDARANRPCRSQLRRAAPFRLKSHSPRPRQAQGRSQGASPHRRNLRCLSRRIAPTRLTFMRLPCRQQPFGRRALGELLESTAEPSAPRPPPISP